ncbi:MAG: hypothetical protein GY847_30060, partial [Proteobacteria bacterium]|nr:hypothetical protein [Pseudomonadota bacterium]
MKKNTNTRVTKHMRLVSACLVIGLSGTAAAQGEMQTEEQELSKTVGINLDAEISSLYNFRGWNTFQEKTQQDQNGLFAPSITWAIFDSGVSIGYWAAYQISGSNQAEMVDVGLGHEQDIFLSYDRAWLNDLLALNLTLTYFFYPFADEDAAGTANPSFLEPLVGLTISDWVDIGINISYFVGLQDAVKDYRYLYINPSVGKGLELSDTFSMNL